MSPWGWTPPRTQGLWRYGPLWLKPFAAAVPWLTVLILLLQFNLIGDTLTSAEGILFDLPAAGLAEGEKTSLVALVTPLSRETLVFFDDARYVLDDPASTAALAEHLAERASRAERKTLLALADRRVSCGELSKFAALARKCGVDRILLANKGTGSAAE